MDKYASCSRHRIVFREDSHAYGNAVLSARGVHDTSTARVDKRFVGGRVARKRLDGPRQGIRGGSSKYVRFRDGRGCRDVRNRVPQREASDRLLARLRGWRLRTRRAEVSYAGDSLAVLHTERDTEGIRSPTARRTMGDWSEVDRFHVVLSWFAFVHKASVSRREVSSGVGYVHDAIRV